jgi:hypothetical protein
MVVGMSVFTTVATEVANGTAPMAALSGRLDIDGNGTLGLPDALGWLLLGAMGVLGIAAVTGVAFAGVAAAAHGLGRIVRRARIGTSPDEPHPERSYYPPLPDAAGSRGGRAR